MCGDFLVFSFTDKSESSGVDACFPRVRVSCSSVQACPCLSLGFPGCKPNLYLCQLWAINGWTHPELCTCWSHLSIDFPTCTLTIRCPYASPCLSYGRDVMLALFLFPHLSAHFLLTLVVYYADYECTASYGALKDIEKLTTSPMRPSVWRKVLPHGQCGTSWCFPVSSSRSPLSGVNGHARSLLYSRFPRYTVSLRNEDLAERCFGCTGSRLRELRLLARPDVCKRPLVPSEAEGDGHGARFVGAFPPGLAG